MIPPSTEFYFGENLFETDWFLEPYRKFRAVLIVDEAIETLYGNAFQKRFSLEILKIPTGEKAKSMQTIQNLLDLLFKMGCGRDTLLIGMGGGVTTDVVGFTASIYLRGVPLILIPTTLLAMVDAAIGGKTGVDTPYGKNLIGTIYPPQAIFCDLSMLKTLPEKEWLNGFAEILKMGLIYDASICEMFEKNSKDPDLFLKAIRGKIAIVGEDLREHSFRRILNFGHTIGHALEIVSNYEMAHGEAVALGSLSEAHLSMDLGYLSKKDFEQIGKMYRSFSFKLPKNYTKDQLVSAMAHDKKKALGQIRFVLLDRIGRAAEFDGNYCREVTQKELEPTLEWIEQWK